MTRADNGPTGRDPFSLVLALLGAVLLGYFALPLAALALVGSPGAALRSLSEPFVVDAAANTLLTATVSTALAVALGVPLAYRLAGRDGRAASLATALVAVPLVLPPVVSGMLLLSVLGAGGPGGLTGVGVSGTHAGVVLAQTFVAAPFVVFTAKSAFEGVDRALVDAALAAGATEWRAFRRVTLPLARRGILAGATLAFARAAGEFGATLVVAYHPRTLPVQIWATFQGRGVEGAFPLALLLVCLAVAALGVLRTLGEGASVWTGR